MADEKSSAVKEARWKAYPQGGSMSAVYGLGFVGAVVYFIQHASSFLDGVLGILKAIIWPALLVYKVLETFKF